MKKLLLLIVIIMLSGSASFSQNKGYVAISLGPSIPTGDFSSKDMNNEAAGFAKTGIFLDLSFAYKIGDNFGVTALLRGQSNKLDGQAISNEMSKKLPDDVSENTSVGSWGVGGILVGGYSSIQITKQLSFESKLMAGFISANSPEILINLNGPGGTAWVKQNSTSGNAFAYLAGIGLKYDAGKRICMIAHVDYLGAKPKFNNVETTTNLLDLQNETNNYTQTFGSVNIGFGVGYRL